MAGETVRTKAADRLADLIAPGADSDELATYIRDSFKFVILTQAAYDALTPKDTNTIYVTVG